MCENHNLSPFPKVFVTLILVSKCQGVIYSRDLHRKLPGYALFKEEPLAGRVSWERNGGRLQRLDKPALQEDVDLLVYDIDNVNAGALAEHTVEQRISLPPGKEASQSQSNDVFDFEVLERIDQLDLALFDISI